MKKLLALVLLLSISLTSCYRVKPNPGEESVLVKKPMFFGHGGVMGVFEFALISYKQIREDKLNSILCG